MEYLNYSQDELYKIIGGELNQKQKNAFPLSSNELIARGQKWFNSKIEIISKAICQNREHLLKESDERKVMLLLIDLVSKLKLGITPATISMLIIKIGIKYLCDSK